eukprot:9472396-Pyramimonas_sp.AAC.1
MTLVTKKALTLPGPIKVETAAIQIQSPGPLGFAGCVQPWPRGSSRRRPSTAVLTRPSLKGRRRPLRSLASPCGRLVTS